ncbi:hypothetical protein BMS3Bbin08_00064 [bacterium BMS3Bbin08]|nr:hypothetical protein BMS3Bbin08_00064 [bacterium BMS3Bbin08]
MLKKEVKVRIGDEGVIVLREPTNKEWNNFEAARFQLARGGGSATTARAQLFDTIVTDIQDLGDETGPITLERKDVIPNRLKAQCIVVGFEMSEIELDEAEIKNS